MSRLYLLATIAALALATRYALLCWLAPFADCHRCHGTGHVRPRLGLRRRPCRHCRGTGKRLRAGRHVANYLTATRRAARAAEHMRTTTTPTAPTGARR